MTREDILEKMGIGDEDFRNYLTKSSEYLASLNEAQLNYHFNSTPAPVTVADAAKALGPDVTAHQIHALFAEALPVDGTLGVNSCCGKGKGGSGSGQGPGDTSGI